MLKDQDANDANVIRALAFEGELRTWLRACALDQDQTDECVSEVYGRLVENKATRLAEAELRRQTFARAREFVLIQWSKQSGTDRAALAQRLPAIPHAPSRLQRRRHAATALERQTRSVQAVSEQCFRVFTLYKVYGFAAPQIAARLSISEAEVTRELIAAVKACTNALFTAPTAPPVYLVAVTPEPSGDPASGLQAAMV